MTLNIVLMTIGILALIESLIVLIFPNWTVKIGRKWLNKKTIKKVGWTELITALILFLIGMNI